ncbi:MAG: single-stranded DNA-binding protein [Myxococcales bacterium]|nr:single-stranded DNA-binding protein [Myxococcales bacterium]
MASINKVFLIGNLGADPEVRYTANGSAVANFRIATSETWNDKSGERQERTEWHRIVVWGRQAEHCGEFLRKGRPVHVEGRIQSREWEDRDGQRRFTTEIIAQSVTFLGGRGEGGGGGSFGGGDGGNYGDGGGGNYGDEGGGYGAKGGGGYGGANRSNQRPNYGGGGGGGYGGNTSKEDEAPALDDSDIPF